MIWKDYPIKHISFSTSNYFIISNCRCSLMRIRSSTNINFIRFLKFLWWKPSASHQYESRRMEDNNYKVLTIISFYFEGDTTDIDIYLYSLILLIHSKGVSLVTVWLSCRGLHACSYIQVSRPLINTYRELHTVVTNLILLYLYILVS